MTLRINFSDKIIGKNIFTDDCESAILAWNVDSYDGGAAVSSTETYWDGSKSIKLSGSVNDPSMGGISKNFNVLENSRIGFEFKWSIDDYDADAFYMYLNHYDGVYERRAYIEVYLKLNIVRIRITDGGIITIPITQTQINDINYWHDIKGVIDYHTNKWVRLIFDDIEYDLSKYNLNLVADVITTPRFNPRVHFFGNGLYNMYIDNIKITNFEP